MINASQTPPFLRNDDNNSGRLLRKIFIHSLILIDGYFNVNWQFEKVATTQTYNDCNTPPQRSDDQTRRSEVNLIALLAAYLPRKDN